MSVLRGLINLVLVLIGAVVAAMMVTGADTHYESDGQSVQLTLSYTVAAKQVAVINGWVGVTETAGESGDEVAVSVQQCERQFTIPSSLDPAIGSIVYIEIADLTGHTPDDTAYSTTAGAGKVAFFKTTSAKDANDVVTGIVLPNLAS